MFILLWATLGNKSNKIRSEKLSDLIFWKKVSFWVSLGVLGGPSGVFGVPLGGPWGVFGGAKTRRFSHLGWTPMRGANNAAKTAIFVWSHNCYPLRDSGEKSGPSIAFEKPASITVNFLGVRDARLFCEDVKLHFHHVS